MSGGRAASWLRELAEIDRRVLAVRVTLLLLLLNPGLGWSERVPVLILAGAGLLAPGLASRPGLWLALCVATGWRVVQGWPLSDNHDYLTSLWCLALATCLVAETPRPALATTARWMLGLTFLFATLWKGVLSPDFVDGTFFRVTLLEDDRFTNFAIVVGGMSDALFDANDEALARHAEGVPWDESGFVEPTAGRRAAGLLTAYTLAIEGGLAVAFLWPGGARIRDALLVLFAVSTFSVASVAGFGWLLMALGIAQCDERLAPRLAYLGAFFLILVYEWVPWSDALARSVQS